MVTNDEQPLGPLYHLERSAVLSDCEAYRYSLSRIWLPGGGRALWVMLNPSTADAEQDDPTIRRCIGFSKRIGMGRLDVVNLFALRATDPAELLHHPRPIGPDNIQTIRRHLTTANVVIAAWGANPAVKKLDAPNLIRLAADSGRPVYCLGTTKSGAPRHPLYVKGDQELVPWQTP